MGFGHEKPDVYGAAIEYVGWAYRSCESLKGHRNAKDQWLRAAQAIPLNIAEGNGKATDGDRRRYFEVARGSAPECGGVQDDQAQYAVGMDTDSDSDTDTDGNRKREDRQPWSGGNACAQAGIKNVTFTALAD